MRIWQSQKNRTACACFPARRNFRSSSTRPPRSNLAYLLSLLVIAALFLSPLATADTLDPPQLIAEMAFNLGERQSTNVFGPLALVDANFGSLSLLSTATPSALLIADAIIGPNPIASVFGRAEILLNYGVEVVGPPGAAAVLIDLTGTASAFANAGASFAVESRWDLLDSDTSLAGDDIGSGQLTGSFGQSFDWTVSLALTANHRYTLFMLVDTASAATLAGSESTAHASVDPVFRLAPGVDPQAYSFLFSPGIGNSPAAVPEPRSFVLLAGGLLCIAVFRRRSGQLLGTSLRTERGMTMILISRRYIGCANALLAMIACSAYAQPFTRQIAASGVASILRPPAISGAQFADLDPSLGDRQDDVESIHRAAGNGPGPAVAATTAVIAKSNPELTLSFDGVRMIDSRLADNANTFANEPPDQGLCAGNGFVLESVNNALRVYDTNGNALGAVISHNTFYGYAVAFNRSTGEFGPSIADPVCHFDPDTQRWFHLNVVLDRVGTTSAFAGTNHLDLAVSQTANPLGAWTIYKIPAQNDGTQGTPDHHCDGGPCLADYPKMGADANGIYITTNEYPLFGGPSRGAQIYALSKRALATGSVAVTVIQYDTSDPALTLDGRPGFTIWPATAPAMANTSDLGGTEYFLSAANDFHPGKSFEPVPTSDNRLRIWALSNTQSLSTGSPALVLRHGVIGVQTYSFPPVANQREGHIPLADCLNDSELPTPLGLGCWRNLVSRKPPGNEREAQTINPSFSMQQVVYADGKLWSTMSTALDLGRGVKGGVAYFVLRPEISSGGVAGSVLKQGYLGLANNHLLHAAVGVTAAGKGIIAFSLTGDDHFPSAAYATLDAVNGAGDIHIAAEGLGPDDGFTAYKAFIGTPQFPRWGDYGATAVDGNSIWIGTEYIGQTCTFGEFVSQQGPNGTCGGTRSSYGNWYTRISRITP